MFFDKMVRAHHVDRVLGQVGYLQMDVFCKSSVKVISVFYWSCLLQARRLFAEYLNEDWTPSPQPNAAQVMNRLLDFIS